MHRVSRSQWIEWLDELRIEGTVEVNQHPHGRSAGVFEFLGADFSPFDDIIELRLRTASGLPRRVLIDHPSGIWTERDQPVSEWLLIDSHDGHTVVARHRPVLHFRVVAPAPSALAVDRPHLLDR
jgi:hypothetical protein